jgi:hypothetical protein
MRVAEIVASIEAAQAQRAARAEQSDKYQKFYRSRAWRAARYQFLTAASALLCLRHDGGRGR